MDSTHHICSSLRSFAVFSDTARRTCSTRCLLLLLLLGLGQTLIVTSEDDSSPADNTIRIGFLMYNKPSAMAIPLAIKQAQNDGLLRDYNFRYHAVCLYTFLYETAQ